MSYERTELSKMRRHTLSVYIENPTYGNLRNYLVFCKRFAMSCLTKEQREEIKAAPISSYEIANIMTSAGNKNK